MAGKNPYDLSATIWDSYREILEGTLAARERNVELTLNVFESGMETLEAQAEFNRRASSAKCFGPSPATRPTPTTVSSAPSPITTGMSPGKGGAKTGRDPPCIRSRGLKTGPIPAKILGGHGGLRKAVSAKK